MIAIINILAILLLLTFIVGIAWAIAWTIHERAWGITISVVFITLLVAILVAAGIASTNSPTITLTKSAWTCTKTAEKDVTTYVKTGSVMTPVTSTVQDCIQYEKN